MIKLIERTTGAKLQAKRIPGGYEVYMMNGEFYKKYRDSTVKRYFKIVGEAVEQNDSDWDESEDSKKASKTQKATEKTAKQLKKEKQIQTELDDVTRENMIEKIRKIFALSKNNPSKNEAIAAAVTAQKLMAKYGIKEDEITLEELAESIAENIVEFKHNAHLLSWYKNLAITVAENFRVKSYLDANKDVVFRGFVDDVKIAGEVYRYLYILGNKMASRAYAEAMEANGTAKGVYNSFVVGYLEGIKEALGEQCTALMLVTPKVVEEDYAEFCVTAGLESKSSKVTGKRDKNFENGKKEGKAAVKSRGIADKKNKSKKNKK